MTGSPATGPILTPLIYPRFQVVMIATGTLVVDAAPAPAHNDAAALAAAQPAGKAGVVGLVGPHSITRCELGGRGGSRELHRS